MIRILKADIAEIVTHTRMPFRYGIATMTGLPHVLVFLTVEVDGKRQEGVSADGLPPK